ncbi:hypothetical protein B0H19DRAFT_1072002 [Mycena capillaripes]|nr:hypothetical protein B0H19DRAFT_1072002 [Mycena capillaripes]
MSARKTFNFQCRLYPTRHVDPSNPYSRIDMQYNFLVYLIGMWVLCAVGWFHTAIQSELLSAVLASCASTDSLYMDPKCIPLGMDLVLPFLIIVALRSSMNALHRCAVSVHGTGIVQFPDEVAPHLYAADLKENSDSEGSTPKFVHVESV